MKTANRSYENRAHMPIVISEAPSLSMGDAITAIPFEQQDWTLADDALLALTKQNWVDWTDADIWAHNEAVDLSFEPEDTPEEDVAVCRELNVVQTRLQSMAVPLRRAAVMLRLQGLTRKPDNVDNKLLWYVAKFLGEVDGMMTLLCEESMRPMMQGEWSEWTKSFKFMEKNVVSSRGIRERLEEYYGKKLWGEFAQKFCSMSDWFDNLD